MENLKRELLAIMRKDCRIPLENLAEMTGTSIKRVAEALQDMEEKHIILRYVPIVNWDLTDKSYVEAMIEVRVTPQREQGFDAIASRIYHFDEVKSMYLMSGDYDLLLLVEAKDLKSLALFVSEKLSTFETIVGTATHFILKRYKSEGVIFKQKNDDSRLVVSP